MLTAPVVLAWSASAIVAMTIAMAKDRSSLAWLAIGLITGPAALAMLAFLPSTGRYAAIRPEPESMELCDACLEPVRRDRNSCRHCGAASAAQLAKATPR